jgi:outer membrane lipoprotein carrier protein
MKKLKLTKLIGLLAFAALNVSAEPVETELRKLLADYDGFTAKFDQQVVDSEQNVLHQAKGQLVFKQPGKFVWKVVEPEQELLQSNGETLWWYNPFLEQVSIYDAKEAVATTPFALLVSNRDEVWNKFIIEKVESGYVIKPKSADDSQVKQLAVHFDKFKLNQIVITDRTEQVSSYSLNSQRFNSANDYQFTFSVPADTEIDDQREAGL